MGKGKSQEVEEDFARLGIKIELTDKLNFSIDQFERFVLEAIYEVLGNCGPIVKIADFNETTRRGSIVGCGNEIQTIWAAVSAKGNFQGRRIAAHFYSLTETDIENIF